MCREFAVKVVGVDENKLYIMTTKGNIKVIKRDQRNTQTKNSKKDSVEKKTPQQAAREVVATVTEWVNEFQQKRRVETAHAIQTLLSDAQPSET